MSDARCPNCERLEAKAVALEAKVAVLEQKIQALERLLDKSERAGKRQAAPFSKGPPKADPNRPGRKAGPEYGQKAQRLPPRHVDEVIRVPLPGRCDCGGTVLPYGVRHQFQEEIPTRPHVRRFDIEHGDCQACGSRVEGRHPLQTSTAAGAARAMLGPQAQALVAYAQKDLGLSYGKIRRLFQTAFSIKLSRGGAAQVVLRAARRTQHAYQQILVVVRRSDVLYPDETGWKVGGLLWWLWTFVAETATLYRLRPSRGFDVAAEVLGEDYRGALGHDGWSPYDSFKQAIHQQCLAHLLRRSNHLLEAATRGAVRFPRAVKALLKASLALRDRRDAGQISPHGLAVATGRLQARLDHLMDWRLSHEGNRTFQKHLRNHQGEIFSFLQHPHLEATNWPAEQAVRGAVVNRKVWGGNRTKVGARAQEILLSVIRTCVQRQVDPITYLAQCLRAPPEHPPDLPTLPEPTLALVPAVA